MSFFKEDDTRALAVAINVGDTNSDTKLVATTTYATAMETSPSQG